jgi:hypothetical protein
MAARLSLPILMPSLMQSPTRRARLDKVDLAHLEAGYLDTEVEAEQR